ncbi:hypothetical protein Hanom_Chr12g01094511 [Helianthus anomalus]
MPRVVDAVVDGSRGHRQWRWKGFGLVWRFRDQDWSTFKFESTKDRFGSVLGSVNKSTVRVNGSCLGYGSDFKPSQLSQTWSTRLTRSTQSTFRHKDLVYKSKSTSNQARKSRNPHKI